MPSSSLPFLCSELVGESVLSIQSSEKVTSISLPPTPPYHTLEFQLEVLCVIPSGSDRPANERLTNGEVRHRPRSYSHPDTPMTAIDQRVRPSNKYTLLECVMSYNIRGEIVMETSHISVGEAHYVFNLKAKEVSI